MQAYTRFSKRYPAFPGPTFKLPARSRQRLIWVNVLPLLMVVAVLLVFILAFTKDPQTSAAFRFSDRLDNISRSLLAFGVPLTLATLFVSGLQKWSRAEGSWMFAIGIGLAVVAFGLGAVGVLIVATVGAENIFDWHPDTWLYMAQQLAFLSVAYFFVANRAASVNANRRTAGRRPRLRRRPGRAGG
jgi:hypothetical protein